MTFISLTCKWGHELTSILGKNGNICIFFRIFFKTFSSLVCVRERHQENIILTFDSTYLMTVIRYEHGYINDSSVCYLFLQHVVDFTLHKPLRARARAQTHILYIYTHRPHAHTNNNKNTQTNSKTRITRELSMWWRVTLLNFPKNPKCALFSIKCTLPFLPPRNVNFYLKKKKIRWISIKGQSSTAHAHQCLVQDTRPQRAIACVSAWVCRACPRGRLLARSRTQVEFVIIIFDRHLGRRACARRALPDEPLLRAHMLAVSGMRLMAGDRLRVCSSELDFMTTR